MPLLRGCSERSGPDLDLPQVVFLDKRAKRAKRASDVVARNERRSREETTCPACMDLNLICILLAGNYCYDVMDASTSNFRSRYSLNRSKLRPCWRKDEFRSNYFCTVLH